MLKSNLRHQVRQTALPKWKPWLPLFEAIMNSFQAIRHANRVQGSGRILIEIKRENSLLGKDEVPIHSIRITDNGIGMDDDNFDSFNTSFSPHKEHEGGKGLGRFTWLKAFERVEVDTVFLDPGTKEPVNRVFVFDEHYDPDKAPDRSAPGRSIGTTIHLIDFKEPYRRETAKTADYIVQRIVEHFLLLFFDPDCPEVVLHDQGTKQSLNAVFEKEYRTTATVHKFEIQTIPFTLHGFRLTTPRVTKHKLVYAADRRGVVSENLDKFVPNLNRRLTDGQGNSFVYLGFVQSPFLSDHVNPARTDFDLEIIEDDDAEPTFAFGPSIRRADIRDTCIERIQDDLSKIIRSINEEKQERIRQYVAQDAPQYKILLRHTDQFIDKISPTASKPEIDAALHREIFHREVKVRAEGARIIKEAEKVDDYDEYQRKLADFMANYNELGASALAQYVGHRRIILDFLDRAITRDANTKKYPLERAVHQLVFPMRTTSDDIPYHEQNLWMIDERLTFHTYIASDKRLDSNEGFTSQDAKRPDLFIYDHKMIFGEGEKDHPVSSITLVEFKKPQRDDYSPAENPVTQCFDLVKRIRSGEFKTSRGRPIALSNQKVPAFCYIISDITPSLKDILETLDAFPTPDNQGYYGFQKTFGIYYEVSDYDKLLNDARKRNRVFLDKLNLASGTRPSA
jgi:hypothetical protein